MLDAIEILWLDNPGQVQWKYITDYYSRFKNDCKCEYIFYPSERNYRSANFKCKHICESWSKDKKSYQENLESDDECIIALIRS